MEYDVEAILREIHEQNVEAVAAGPLKLSVVIPARNEAETIEATLREIVASLDRKGVDYEVIVVDDASSDGTAAVVDGVGARRARASAACARTSATGSASPCAPGWRRSRATRSRS